MTAMDKLWTGPEGEQPPQGPNQQQRASSAAAAGPTAAATTGLDAAAAGQQATRLQAALGAGDGDEVYVQVACKQLVGLYLSVWVRKGLARHVRGVQTTSVATGWGGYIGNKGELHGVLFFWGGAGSGALVGGFGSLLRVLEVRWRLSLLNLLHP